MKTRNTRLSISLIDSKDIGHNVSSHIESWVYRDWLTGSMNSLELTFCNMNLEWLDSYFPKMGTRLKCECEFQNRIEKGDNPKRSFGAFCIDAAAVSFPPSTATFRARAIPFTVASSRELRNKAWEKTSLKTIAGEIAGKAKLTLSYKGDDIKFDRIEQNNRSDLDFLYELTSKNQMSMRISDNKLNIWDEETFEKQKPTMTITPTSADLISMTLTADTADIYYAASLKYKDPKSKKLISAEIKATDAPDGVSQRLNLSDRASDGADAKKKAQKALKNKNKKLWQGVMTVMGNPELISGTVVELSGFGKYSRKYLVTETLHSGGNDGYTTKITMRGIVSQTNGGQK